jgi:hypothetical protein
MITRMCTIIAITAAAAVTVTRPPSAQENSEQRLGTMHFQTSCNDTAQRRFDRGMRYQHSFWYREAEEIFQGVLKADPSCAIAYWGIALSLLNNPFNPIPAVNLPQGLEAISKAEALGAKTERERDFINALALMYKDYDKVDQRTRVLAYFKAFEQVAQRYPNDDETQIFYALALDVAASPSDKTYANQLKAASILEPIFARLPQHPGVAHYLIHTYDYPPIAEKGLNAALRYSKIAPAAPHAQHMPSHIFTRVGYWKDSIESNSASARAAKTEKEPDDQMHAQDYQVYAYLQLAQDKSALGVIDEMKAVTGSKRNAGPFALAASQARYALERGDWKGAADLQARPSDYRYTEAITYFARAVGASRGGDPQTASTDIAKLSEARDKLREAKDAYWAEQVDIQRQTATAWMLFAEGKRDEGFKVMSAAADAEDKTEKAPITPGPIVPARELYGHMLLEGGATKEALAAFEATLKKEPHRLGATIGAARAAHKIGDEQKAKQHYAGAVELSKEADPVRPEIAEARGFVASGR